MILILFKIKKMKVNTNMDYYKIYSIANNKEIKSLNNKICNRKNTKELKVKEYYICRKTHEKIEKKNYNCDLCKYSTIIKCNFKRHQESFDHAVRLLIALKHATVTYK